MVMQALEDRAFEIPDAIWQMEVHNDEVLIDTLDELFLAEANSEVSYVSKFATMVHMEEAASSKRFVVYDLNNVKLLLKSHEHKTFMVEVSILNSIEFYLHR